MALLSDIRSGLLGLGSSAVDAGQSIGRGIGRGAGLLGQQLAQPLSQGVKDIPDVMRFYEAQRMAQPMMSYDPADLRPVTPMGVTGMLPTLRAAEQEAVQKPMLDALRLQQAKRGQELDELRLSLEGARLEQELKAAGRPKSDELVTVFDRGGQQKTVRKIVDANNRTVFFDPESNKPLAASEFLLKKPEVAPRESTTVYIGGEPQTAIKTKDASGNPIYLDPNSRAEIPIGSDFSLVKPSSSQSEIKTEKPFTVKLTKDFEGNKEGDFVTVQSVTIDGQESLYNENEQGRRLEIPTSVFTSEYVSPADVLSASIPTIEKLSKTISDEQGALAGIDRFATYAERAQEVGLGGIRSKIAALSGGIKSLGDGKLNERERLQRFLVANQQGTLGRLRIEILGPGVLTDRDAERLIASMGTDINSWFANLDLLRSTLADIRAEKLDALDDTKRRREAYAAGRIPEPSQRITAPTSWFKNGGTYAAWDALTNEEKREAMAASIEGDAQ